jgi:mRNA interferase MazF
VNRGEVWWAYDEVGGRPYLVLTRDAVIPLLTRVVAVPLTRTARGIPSELPLGPDDGLPEPCVATFDNVTSMPKRRFRERICTLPPTRMRDVCRALRIAVDC